jgi:hypothetical protein
LAGRRAVPEDVMIHIKVQYDAGNRTFKLVDQEFRTLLEGDALYDLAVPFIFEEADIEDLISASNASVGHA